MLMESLISGFTCAMKAISRLEAAGAEDEPAPPAAGTVEEEAPLKLSFSPMVRLRYDTRSGWRDGRITCCCMMGIGGIRVKDTGARVRGKACYSLG